MAAKRRGKTESGEKTRWPPETRHAPTSSDVARCAGVSRATVSYVLNNVPDCRVGQETWARVRAAADELGYTPHAVARSLRVGHSDLVLVPLSAVPSGPILDAYYDTLAARLRELGYTVIFHADRSARGVEAARSWATLRPVGIMVEAERLTRPALDLLRAAGTRAILATGWPPSKLVPTLVVDHASIGAAAAEHLVSSGHRHLAVVVPRERRLMQLGLARLRGVQQVAAAHGLQADRVDLAYDEREGAELAAGWRQTRPTAVFTYNDDYAMLLMRSLLDAGLAIPEDIALVGADDLPLCTLLRPRLTSVHLEAAAQAPAVAETLHAMIQGQMPDMPAIELLRPRIVARESG